MGRTIHFCGFCDYKSDRKNSRDKHILRKHPLPQTKKLHSCTLCNRKFEKGYQLQLHKQISHNLLDTPEEVGMQTDLGTQTDIAEEPTFQKVDVIKLINESFEFFQNYMKMKMEHPGFESNEIIKEGIDITRFVMIKKLCK